ncbi:MAG: PEP-CTERM sorting domain-containing protein [Acidobacteria bacterium]|nr:PEP-CTERM sorting domain-containing protein [Acidobacteriota bacterium]
MRRIVLKSLLAVLIVAGALAFTPVARAASVTITGSSGSNTASATFTMITSSVLQVTLSNTSLSGATSFDDVLTGFFFSSNMATLNPTSVRVASGSSIRNCSYCGTSTNVSTQFLSQSGYMGLNGEFASNILAATDFGFLTDRVGTTSVNTPGTNGIGYGLVASTTNFGQSLFTGSPLISSTVIVNYSLLGSGLDLNSITGGFLWGTTLVPLTPYSPYSFSPYSGDAAVPEPGTATMLLVGFAGVIFVQRRRRRV